jgi:hypothetical protein
VLVCLHVSQADGPAATTTTSKSRVGGKTAAGGSASSTSSASAGSGAGAGASASAASTRRASTAGRPPVAAGEKKEVGDFFKNLLNK